MPEIQDERIQDSVDQILALRRDMPIQRFFLQWSNHCDQNRVCNWFRVVARCKVKQLDLRFKKTYICRASSLWDLLNTCNRLLELTLDNIFVLEVPKAGWLLPCLKKINLIQIKYLGKQSLENLISGCPVLEELSLDTKWLYDGVPTVNVSSTSLKRLKVTSVLVGFYEFVIDTPELEYLYIVDHYKRKYSLMNPLVLAEAHINSGSEYSVVKLLSSAKILTLGPESIAALNRIDDLNLPMFPNVVKLMIAWCGYLLPVMLKNMPNLERLTVTDETVHSIITWIPPMEEAPACLRVKMKEIIIKSKKLAVISYLLKHSKVLEKLTIHSCKINLRSASTCLSTF